MQVQVTAGGTKEGTHRSRSFLFAVLGAITAQAFGRNRVSFYENGVVSLNLPPVGNVLGTRATRTTHPQTLARFTDFFDLVFDDGVRVDNPFFWRTKTEVVETIARLGMADQIAHTRSCADTHNQTIKYVHCGRCSQCIDRRFAALAAGLPRFDPEEAYRVRLMEDPRPRVVDREVALSYVRNAQTFEHMTPETLEWQFPAVLDAVRYLDNPPETVLSLITQLLKRHGASVLGVMRDAFSEWDAQSYPEGSLPPLYGDAQREAVLPAIVNTATKTSTAQPEVVTIQIDEKRQQVNIDNCITLRANATSGLLIELAKVWLEGAGQGFDPLDYPVLSAAQLTGRLGLETEEALRRRVRRARTILRQKFESSGLSGDMGERLIENIPWHGYRLAPDAVAVRVCKEG